jgi:hypothetical protein
MQCISICRILLQVINTFVIIPFARLLLLPANVFLRDWFQDVIILPILNQPTTTPSGPNTYGRRLNFFVAPHKRYSFECQLDELGNESFKAGMVSETGEHTPFVTMW